MRIVTKNDTGRPISKFRFRAVDPADKFSPSGTHSGAVVEPGMVDVYEITPAPDPSYRTIVLQATFADVATNSTTGPKK